MSGIKTEITNNVGQTTQAIARSSPDALFKATMKGGGLVKNAALERLRARGSKVSNNTIKVSPHSDADGGPESRIGVSMDSKQWAVKFLDTGAKKHEIEPKDAKALSWGLKTGKVQLEGQKTAKKYYVTKSGKYTMEQSEADVVTVKVVHHPGMKKDPTMVPAYQDSLPGIKQVMADAAVKVIKDSINNGGGA